MQGERKAEDTGADHHAVGAMFAAELRQRLR
jgi:hypothetical protein